MGHLIVFVVRRSKWLWKSEIRMYNKKVILVFGKILGFICTRLRSAGSRSFSTVSAERRLVQIKSRILQNTVE